MTQVVSFERYYHIGVLTWLQQSYKPQKRIKRGILQNEPIFQNLYIKDTKKTKTFFLSTIYQIMEVMIAEKLLNFVE